MRKLLGRIGEWAVTHPAPTIAGVVSVVAIVTVVGALRLSPDAGTDKLVDNGSAAFEGTEVFRDRFGDDAIVVLVEGDLEQLVLTDNIQRLLSLEGCLAGNPQGDGQFTAPVCEEIDELGATRVVFGPATFLNEAANRTKEAVPEQFQALQAQGQAAAEAAARQAAELGATPEQQAAAAEQAQGGVIQQAIQELSITGVDPTVLLGASITSTEFVQSIVFDQGQPGVPPKSKFGYLFPSSESALISIRLQPEITDEERRAAIGLIEQAVGEDEFKLRYGATYSVSGVPVVVQGLADELGGEIILLFLAALVVMALVLIGVFGPPLRLLPLATAIGAAGFAFGLLSLLGGTLTMASVAVLPVVIGLAVDYAIQLQARFREAAESGERPPAAAVIAAVRGGPVIGTAALATAAGFLSLTLSPIPMVREFAVALVAGIFAALLISLTAGLAALSLVRTEPRSRARRFAPRLPAAGGSLADAARSGSSAARRVSSLLTGIRAHLRSAGRSALATAIASPGRVLLVATVLAAVGWVAGTGTKVVSDIRQLVPADLPALQSVDRLQDATGVSGELDVIVSGDVTSPEAITWMSDFKERVLEQHGFGGEFPACTAEGTELCPGPSLADLFAVSGEEELSPERIDGVLDAVPPYFSQAILSQDEERGDVASLAFLIPVMPLDEQEVLIDEIRAELDAPADDEAGVVGRPEGIEAEVVGLPVLAADANSELAGSRYLLTISGLLAVGLILLAVYRNVSRALVPLLPIALATGWSALVLEATGIPLNPMSATLGALVIAVATEFSVILSARYHEEREAGASIGEALRMTYSRTGTAVLASGITSIAGFGVLALSGITMLRDFGLVTVVDLSVALAGVMLVLPAALVWAEGGYRPFPAAWRAVRPARPGSGADVRA